MWFRGVIMRGIYGVYMRNMGGISGYIGVYKGHTGGSCRSYRGFRMGFMGLCAVYTGFTCGSYGVCKGHILALYSILTHPDPPLSNPPNSV